MEVETHSDNEDGDGRNLPSMAVLTTERSRPCWWKNRTFPTLVLNLEKLADPVIHIIVKNLPRSRTSSENAYLYITLVGKIHCDSRKTNRHLHSLICGTRYWCRTFQSTFFTVHSKLWLTCPQNRTRASTVGGEHSRKEPFEQLVNSYSEHLHMSVRPVENASDKLLVSHWPATAPPNKNYLFFSCGLQQCLLYEKMKN